jgi:hypothetical protein
MDKPLLIALWATVVGIVLVVMFIAVTELFRRPDPAPFTEDHFDLDADGSIDLPANAHFDADGRLFINGLEVAGPDMEGVDVVITVDGDIEWPEVTGKLQTEIQ